MKIQIVYTVEVSDQYRRAINVHYGRTGLATRAQVLAWHQRFGTSLDEDVMRELEIQVDQGLAEQAARDQAS